VFRRALNNFALALRHGPRVVLLAREARRRGAVQKKAELPPLISLLRSRKPKVVLEIGTYRGGTLWLWCRVAAPNAFITSIDLPGGQFGGGYDESYEVRFRSFTKPEQQLVLLRRDSHDAATLRELMEALDGRSIDFLFIDGDHSYEGIKQDFETYSPFVGHNGVIAIHDILPHTVETDCQVHVFWSELKQRGYRMRELVDTRPSPSRGLWGGIGVIFVG
jgi:predicted O-methyltransferase YrrM